MLESFSLWLHETAAGKALLTMFISMLPVVELRGGLPAGVAMGLPIHAAFLASLVGNMIPVPFIILFVRPLFKWVRIHIPRLGGFVSRLENRAREKSADVLRYQTWGLLIFVAIPLPGTGAWTGALIAAVLDMRLKRAVPVILLGVTIAGCIITMLTHGVSPKDVAFYKQAPLMTSHLTFKGNELFGKEAPKSGKLAQNALGTLMVGNTLTRSADQSAILSMPSTIQYVSITEENFWRCVGSYAFRRTIDAGWSIAKKEISAPNTSVEGYDLWLKNALVMFLFEYKSMQSSLRGISWCGDTVDIVNKLFYLDEATIREHCHDEVILKDLETHPLQNQFILQKIEECKPYWSPQMLQLYNFCVGATLATYDIRKSVNYLGSLECADAGFQQLRSGGVFKGYPTFDDDLTKLLTQARDYLRKDIDKYGFVSEVISTDE